jgi:hypothetical protein
VRFRRRYTMKFQTVIGFTPSSSGIERHPVHTTIKVEVDSEVCSPSSSRKLRISLAKAKRCGRREYFQHDLVGSTRIRGRITSRLSAVLHRSIRTGNVHRSGVLPCDTNTNVINTSNGRCVSTHLMTAIVWLKS